MSKNILPVAAVDRLIRSAGAARVSESAARALGEVLEEYGADLSRQAMEFAGHANRKTVTAADVKLAVKAAK